MFLILTVYHRAGRGLESKIPIQVKTVYSDQIGYGNFISQSEEAGKEYSDSDTLPTVKVVYSLGQPYLKDIRHQATEGDLPKCSLMSTNRKVLLYIMMSTM